MRLLYLGIATALFSCASLAAVLDTHGRALDDVFGGLDAPSVPQIPADHAITAEHATTTAHGASGVMTLGLLSSLGISTKTSSKENTTHSQTTATASPTSYSIIGTIPPLPSYTPWSSKPPPSTTPATPTPTSSPLSAAQSGSRSTSSWKIVGVAVIAFTTVAAILLLSVFFDQWWSFMRDLVWKKKRKAQFEEFVPDWEKASWEINANSTAHNRYPSFAGPRRKEQGQDECEEKDDSTMVGNAAGVGSWQKSYEDPSPPSQPTHSNWSLGFVTPVPPPPALHTNFRTRDNTPPFDRKSRAFSTSYSDVDPYAGIE